ncbi:hypothetical protein KY366_04370 [Candidatus Woesearchaeota archaeon]|nr:hypothetical protein [Candidatus Woesearchaeota archaeon]
MRKKGQGGLNAAILVAIIAAFIIIYILFLPAGDRQKLLEEESSYAGSTISKNKTIILFSESVGRMDPVGRVRDKELPNVNIFETTNSQVIDTINPIYVKNGWFDKSIKVIKFHIDDLDITDNIVLIFSAPKRKGILSIKLNNELIYEYDINSLNVEPIKLKKNMLNEDNEFEFSVSGVGGKFWSTNEYALEDVKIIGDITDLSRQESSNVFTLTDTEYQNLEKAEIKFVPYCITATKVGVLDLFINSRNIFSAVPVCNDRYTQEIPMSALSSGQNSVIFKTNKGKYAIEQIKLNFMEKDVPEAVYYFEINSTAYDVINDDKEDEYDAFIKINFVEDKERKRADLNINDHYDGIDQEKKVYSRKIDGWLEEGNNFIKITPKTVLDIINIRVELEEN